MIFPRNIFFPVNIGAMSRRVATFVLVAVGFNPRKMDKNDFRRVATAQPAPAPAKGTVATRRRFGLSIFPWVETHGYQNTASLRDANGAGILLITAFLFAPFLQSAPIADAPLPGDAVSEVFSVSADSVPVPVVKFGDVNYARFTAAGAGTVTITARGHKINNTRVSPLNTRHPPRRKGETLAFAVEPGFVYFARADNLPPLILFADAPETNAPRPGGAGVVDLSTYLPPNRDPAAPATAFIQKAIDDTAALAGGAGGVLYIPDGHYISGQLKLKSNVHLHLSAGALLQSQVDFNATDFPRQANGDSSFIFIENARNVRISGRGVIDGNGYAVRSRNPRANIKLLRSAGAGDLTIENVFFRDAARWTLHFLDSERVTLRNFKLVNDLRGGPDPKEKVHRAVVTNTDGVDLDAVRGALVEGGFIYTGDDAFAPKVTNYMGRSGPCRDLVMRNNTIWTIKCALKVGDDDTVSDFSEIVFDRNYIIHADRFLALWSTGGQRMSGIRATGNLCEEIGGDYNERFFMFRARPRHAPAIRREVLIDNVLVRDFHAPAPAPQPSSMEGLDKDGRITGVTFENIVIGGKHVKSAEDIPMTVRNFADAPVFVPSLATQ
jgi:hypothetical protein